MSVIESQRAFSTSSLQPIFSCPLDPRDLTVEANVDYATFEGVLYISAYHGRILTVNVVNQTSSNRDNENNIIELEFEFSLSAVRWFIDRGCVFLLLGDSSGSIHFLLSNGRVLLSHKIIDNSSVLDISVVKQPNELLPSLFICCNKGIVHAIDKVSLKGLKDLVSTNPSAVNAIKAKLSYREIIIPNSTDLTCATFIEGYEALLLIHDSNVISICRMNESKYNHNQVSKSTTDASKGVKMLKAKDSPLVAILDGNMKILHLHKQEFLLQYDILSRYDDILLFDDITSYVNVHSMESRYQYFVICLKPGSMEINAMMKVLIMITDVSSSVVYVIYDFGDIRMDYHNEFDRHETADKPLTKSILSKTISDGTAHVVTLNSEFLSIIVRVCYGYSKGYNDLLHREDLIQPESFLGLIGRQLCDDITNKGLPLNVLYQLYDVFVKISSQNYLGFHVTKSMLLCLIHLECSSNIEFSKLIDYSMDILQMKISKEHEENKPLIRREFHQLKNYVMISKELMNCLEKRKTMFKITLNALSPSTKDTISYQEILVNQLPRRINQFLIDFAKIGNFSCCRILLRGHSSLFNNIEVLLWVIDVLSQSLSKEYIELYDILELLKLCMPLLLRNQFAYEKAVILLCERIDNRLKRQNIAIVDPQSFIDLVRYLRSLLISSLSKYLTALADLENLLQIQYLIHLYWKDSIHICDIKEHGFVGLLRDRLSSKPLASLVDDIENSVRPSISKCYESDIIHESIDKILSDWIADSLETYSLNFDNSNGSSDDSMIMSMTEESEISVERLVLVATCIKDKFHQSFSIMKILQLSTFHSDISSSTRKSFETLVVIAESYFDTVYKSSTDKKHYDALTESIRLYRIRQLAYDYGFSNIDPCDSRQMRFVVNFIATRLTKSADGSINAQSIQDALKIISGWSVGGISITDIVSKGIIARITAIASTSNIDAFIQLSLNKTLTCCLQDLDPSILTSVCENLLCCLTGIIEDSFERLGMSFYIDESAWCSNTTYAIIEMEREIAIMKQASRVITQSLVYIVGIYLDKSVEGSTLSAYLDSSLLNDLRCLKQLSDDLGIYLHLKSFRDSNIRNSIIRQLASQKIELISTNTTNDQHMLNIDGRTVKACRLLDISIGKYIQCMTTGLLEKGKQDECLSFLSIAMERGMLQYSADQFDRNHSRTEYINNTLVNDISKGLCAKQMTLMKMSKPTQLFAMNTREKKVLSIEPFQFAQKLLICSSLYVSDNTLPESVDLLSLCNLVLTILNRTEKPSLLHKYSSISDRKSNSLNFITNGSIGMDKENRKNESIDDKLPNDKSNKPAIGNDSNTKFLINECHYVHDGMLLDLDEVSVPLLQYLHREMKSRVMSAVSSASKVQTFDDSIKLIEILQKSECHTLICRILLGSRSIEALQTNAYQALQSSIVTLTRKTMAYRDIDTNLIICCLCNLSYETMVRELKMVIPTIHSNYSRLNLISNIGEELARLWNQDQLLLIFQGLQINAKWWNILSSKGISIDSKAFQSSDIQSRNQCIRGMVPKLFQVLSIRESIDKAIEYCQHFDIEPSFALECYLEHILVRDCSDINEFTTSNPDWKDRVLEALAIRLELSQAVLLIKNILHRIPGNQYEKIQLVCDWIVKVYNGEEVSSIMDENKSFFESCRWYSAIIRCLFRPSSNKPSLWEFVDNPWPIISQRIEMECIHDYTNIDHINNLTLCSLMNISKESYHQRRIIYQYTYILKHQKDQFMSNSKSYRQIFEDIELNVRHLVMKLDVWCNIVCILNATLLEPYQNIVHLESLNKSQFIALHSDAGESLLSEMIDRVGNLLTEYLQASTENILIENRDVMIDACKKYNETLISMSRRRILNQYLPMDMLFSKIDIPFALRQCQKHVRQSLFEAIPSNMMSMIHHLYSLSSSISWYTTHQSVLHEKETTTQTYRCHEIHSIVLNCLDDSFRNHSKLVNVAAEYYPLICHQFVNVINAIVNESRFYHDRQRNYTTISKEVTVGEPLDNQCIETLRQELIMKLLYESIDNVNNMGSDLGIDGMIGSILSEDTPSIEIPSSTETRLENDCRIAFTISFIIHTSIQYPGDIDVQEYNESTLAILTTLKRILSSGKGISKTSRSISFHPHLRSALSLYYFTSCNRNPLFHRLLETDHGLCSDNIGRLILIYSIKNQINDLRLLCQDETVLRAFGMKIVHQSFNESIQSQSTIVDIHRDTMCLHIEQIGIPNTRSMVKTWFHDETLTVEILELIRDVLLFSTVIVNAMIHSSSSSSSIVSTYSPKEVLMFEKESNDMMFELCLKIHREGNHRMFIQSLILLNILSSNHSGSYRIGLDDILNRLQEIISFEAWFENAFILLSKKIDETIHRLCVGNETVQGNIRNVLDSNALLVHINESKVANIIASIQMMEMLLTVATDMNIRPIGSNEKGISMVNNFLDYALLQNNALITEDESKLRRTCQWFGITIARIVINTVQINELSESSQCELSSLCEIIETNISKLQDQMKNNRNSPNQSLIEYSQQSYETMLYHSMTMICEANGLSPCVFNILDRAILGFNTTRLNLNEDRDNNDSLWMMKRKDRFKRLFAISSNHQDVTPRLDNSHVLETWLRNRELQMNNI